MSAISGFLHSKSSNRAKTMISAPVSAEPDSGLSWQKHLLLVGLVLATAGCFSGRSYEPIPVAEVVPARPDAPPDAKALAQHCRGGLPGYKVPREFRMVEALARTVTGKLARS